MSNPDVPYTGITAGEIIKHLQQFPPETDIHIEGMVFYRWKWRGENLLAMELSPFEPDFSPEQLKPDE